MADGSITVRRSFVRILVSLAGLGVLVFLFYRLGPNNVLPLFRQIGWRFLVIVFIYGSEELIRAAALLQCLPRESRPVFRQIVYIRLIGEAVRAVTLTGPLLSEPTRAWFIRSVYDIYIRMYCTDVRTTPGRRSPISNFLSPNFKIRQVC
jgi:hypothetical protein